MTEIVYTSAFNLESESNKQQVKMKKLLSRFVAQSLPLMLTNIKITRDK